MKKLNFNIKNELLKIANGRKILAADIKILNNENEICVLEKDSSPEELNEFLEMIDYTSTSEFMEPEASGVVVLEKGSVLTLISKGERFNYTYEFKEDINQFYADKVLEEF